MPLVCEDLIHENTKCEQCGFNFKSSCGLKVYIPTQHRISQIDGASDIEENKFIGTQTEKNMSFLQR